MFYSSVNDSPASLAGWAAYMVASFFVSSNNPRTVVYVDGFNLYYGAVKGTPYKWLDLEKYFQLLRPHDDLQAIRYFTALISGAHRANQLAFIQALETRPLISIVLGAFKQKRVLCEYARCHPSTPGDRVFSKSEEKRTDVNIAVHMLADAFREQCDHQILVTGDSDLVPAIRMIRDRFPSIKTTVYVPAQAPQRGYAVELRTAAHKHRVLPLNLLKLAQFPTQVTDGSGGVIEKPAGW